MTAETFKAWLRDQGKTIDQWAVENGFPPSATYRALNGVDKGNFGRAHRILVTAGIKKGVACTSSANTQERRSSHDRRAA